MAQKKALTASMNETLAAHSSRERFALRKQRINAIFLALFIMGIPLIGFLTSRFHPMAIPLILGEAVYVSVLYFMWNELRRQPIKLNCPKCDLIILSNIEWVCVSCGERADDPSWHQFLDKCDTCKEKPTTYECHKCGNEFSLGQQGASKRMARRYIPPELIPKRADTISESDRMHQAEVKRKLQKLELAELDAEIRKKEKDIVEAEPGSPEEKEFKRIEKYSDSRSPFDTAMQMYRDSLKQKYAGRENQHILRQKMRYADEYEQIRFAELTQQTGEEN